MKMERWREGGRERERYVDGCVGSEAVILILDD